MDDGNNMDVINISFMAYPLSELENYPQSKVPAEMHQKLQLVVAAD